jgi:hypothetical protein
VCPWPRPGRLALRGPIAPPSFQPRLQLLTEDARRRPASPASGSGRLSREESVPLFSPPDGGDMTVIRQSRASVSSSVAPCLDKADLPFTNPHIAGSTVE